MRITTKSYDNFQYGVADDPRIDRDGFITAGKNLDILSHPESLFPSRILDEIDQQPYNSSRGYQFIVEGDNNIAYGVLSDANGTPRIHITTETGSSTQSNPAITAGAVSFVTGKGGVKVGNLIYGWQDGGDIWEYDLDTNSVTYQKFTTTDAVNEQPRPISGSDDVQYFPYNDSNGLGHVATLNAGVFTDGAFDLPGKVTASSIFEDNNTAYAVKRSNGNTDIVIWDGVSPAPSTIINMGVCDIFQMDFKWGTIIALAKTSNSRTYVRAYTPNNGSSYEEQSYTDIRQITHELPQDPGSSWGSIVTKDRIYFPHREGIWAVGRRPGSSRWAVYLEVSYQNDPGTELEWIDPTRSDEITAGIGLVGDRIVSVRNSNQNNTSHLYRQNGTLLARAEIDTVVEDFQSVTALKRLHRAYMYGSEITSVDLWYRMNNQGDYIKLAEPVIGQNGVNHMVIVSREEDGSFTRNGNEIEFKFRSKSPLHRIDIEMAIINQFK